MKWRTLAGLFLLVWLASCVKHGPLNTAYTPITTFSGRLLVMAPKHRFQVEIDWQANEEKGQLRLTHALSGRVVFVRWQGHRMFWLDNHEQLSWQPLSAQALKDMGIILPPWQLAKIFLGQMPDSMHSKDKRKWEGAWLGTPMQIKWSSNYKRLELIDYKHGQRAVVMIDG